ncbi:MAG: tRNA dihydrouridine synthase DusB [Verrucomicrobiales bacterium]|nr:tRNA dihydrouridine synthase DusB [Verrucomicrobiales bacterium]
MLPWFQNTSPPLFLAPMAGVTDIVFRHICKELGADAMVTEFVSAEGIIRQDQRTRKYTEFTDSQRPLGVQLFGADGTRMGEAAKKIVTWKAPDFIDINFGCPVNKVVSKNGGSSLLRDCPLLCDTAKKIVDALAPLGVPVTAKIRIGWDSTSVNAPHVCQLLQDVGIQAVSVHGRTRAQGYSGEADWDVIGQCAEAVSIPVVGNGDITSGNDVEKRLRETSVSGLMIGRAAMQNPWIFKEAKHYLATGEHLPPASIEDRWALIKRHCNMAVDCNRYGNELQTMQAMRSRLMAYSRGLPNGKRLRSTFATVSSLAHLDEIASEYLDHLQKTANAA